MLHMKVAFLGFFLLASAILMLLFWTIRILLHLDGKICATWFGLVQKPPTYRGWCQRPLIVSQSWNDLKRSAGEETEITDTDYRQIECKEQQLETTPGTLTFISDGAGKFCSLFLAAPIDHVVEMEFTFLEVDCEDDSAVAILDGWELDFEIFPSPEDHPHPMSLRYISFCGRSRPESQFISKQNIAQIQFIVPIEGQGFQVKVTFSLNYKPCNMMLLTNTYHKITLRNYGLSKNCTVLSLYPQRVQFLYVNIGENGRETLIYQPLKQSKTGLRTACQTSMAADSVQLYQGSGVGSSGMKLVVGFCGIRQTVARRTIGLKCHSSALRLESSGEYYNVVKFAFIPAGENDETEC